LHIPEAERTKPHLDEQLHEVYVEHVEQVRDLRAKAAELLANSDLYATGEFDPGPPPPDFPNFMAILQLIRQWGPDSNAILRDSGYSLGRLLMIVRALNRHGISLPRFKPIEDDDRKTVEADFRAALMVNRPKIDEHFHQSPCDSEAVVSRVRHMAVHNWLKDRPVLVLGDDDGLGIALARYTEAEVHVLDIDARVLGFTREIASRDNLRIQLYRHDLRNPLPDAMVGRFWMVSADPPQSAAGEAFFLERAIEALMPAPGHRVYCSITPMWMGNTSYHSVLAHMIRRGFATREILKSAMTFSLRCPSNRVNSEIDAAVGGMLNMACDVHVFQRMVSV